MAPRVDGARVEPQAANRINSHNSAIVKVHGVALDGQWPTTEHARSGPDAFRATIVVHDGGAIVLDDEDDVLLELVVRMRDAGVEVVTMEEGLRRAEVQNAKWSS